MLKTVFLTALGATAALHLVSTVVMTLHPKIRMGNVTLVLRLAVAVALIHLVKYLW